MSKFLIRHGLSQANNRGSLAFASDAAPLMDEGRNQARLAADVLRSRHDIVDFTQTVAVSGMRRTHETAESMGFMNLHEYPGLSEVNHGVDLAELRKMLDQDKLPDAALRAAERIMNDPPTEEIWVTHGLVIAGLCKHLGVEDRAMRLVPKFCEIRRLPIQ